MPLPARLKHEGDRSFSSFVDYLDLGPGRTLGKLLQMYKQFPKSKAMLGITDNDFELTIRNWFQDFLWEARAESYETEIAERSEILTFHERMNIRKEKLETIKVLSELKNILNNSLKTNIAQFNSLSYDKQIACAVSINKLWKEIQADIEQEITGEELLKKAKEIAYQELLDQFPDEVKRVVMSAIKSRVLSDNNNTFEGRLSGN